MSEADDSLRRIESLIDGLDALADPAARQLARGLLEVVLDLHGLALSRIAAIVAAAPGGPALLERMAEESHVRAVLLLHGLHPDEAAERIGQAVATLNRELAEAGARVGVLGVAAGSARLSARPGELDPAALRARIEIAVVDAAPELEELVIEGLDLVGAEASPALAG